MSSRGLGRKVSHKKRDFSEDILRLNSTTPATAITATTTATTVTFTFFSQALTNDPLVFGVGPDKLNIFAFRFFLGAFN